MAVGDRIYVASRQEVNQHIDDKTNPHEVTAEQVGAEPVLPAERKRKITFGTAEPTGGVDGDIYFKYKA